MNDSNVDAIVALPLKLLCHVCLHFTARGIKHAVPSVCPSVVYMFAIAYIGTENTADTEILTKEECKSFKNNYLYGTDNKGMTGKPTTTSS